VSSSGTSSVTPAASVIYMLTATNPAGTATASVAITVTDSAADATISIDTGQDRRPISPFVYGYNAGSAANAPPRATWLRLGGNRWTAYNSTNNYSNAGSDYGPYHNDNLMGSPADGPGHAAVPSIDDARAHGLGLLVTIPIQGWASKVRLGNEFANFLAYHWGNAAIPIHFSLDNEPDLWSSTHAEIQRGPLRYVDL
jgi:glycosyl hydrolase family 44